MLLLKKGGASLFSGWECAALWLASCCAGASRRGAPAGWTQQTSSRMDTPIPADKRCGLNSMPPQELISPPSGLLLSPSSCKSLLWGKWSGTCGQTNRDVPFFSFPIMTDTTALCIGGSLTSVLNEIYCCYNFFNRCVLLWMLRCGCAESFKSCLSGFLFSKIYVKGKYRI